MNYTLENFINFCDDMYIAEEAVHLRDFKGIKLNKEFKKHWEVYETNPNLKAKVNALDAIDRLMKDYQYRLEKERKEILNTKKGKVYGTLSKIFGISFAVLGCVSIICSPKDGIITPEKITASDAIGLGAFGSAITSIVFLAIRGLLTAHVRHVHLLISEVREEIAITIDSLEEAIDMGFSRADDEGYKAYKINKKFMEDERNFQEQQEQNRQEFERGRQIVNMAYSTARMQSQQNHEMEIHRFDAAKLESRQRDAINSMKALDDSIQKAVNVNVNV